MKADEVLLRSTCRKFACKLPNYEENFIAIKRIGTMPQANADCEPSEATAGRALRFKKGKLSASLSLPRPTASESSDEKRADSATLPLARLASRNASSKYDIVKVKVWLGENADHYYVFSRFLLCRMLTVTKIPNHVAIQIALELKKLLVDNSLLDVYLISKHSIFIFRRMSHSQSDLEANLFKLMERRGYGQEYINLYKMKTRICRCII